MPEPKHTPKELNGQTGFKRVCFVRGENTLIGLSEFKRGLYVSSQYQKLSA